MLPNNLTAAPKSGTTGIKISIENCSAVDYALIQQTLALFADPAQSARLTLIKGGVMAVAFDATGKMKLVPLLGDVREHFGRN
jgi:hypothetical protein